MLQGGKRVCVFVLEGVKRERSVCVCGGRGGREGNEGKNEREGERKEYVFTSSAVLEFSGSRLLHPHED